MKSQIDPAMIAAYRRTQYRVSQHLSLWIDESNSALADWQARHGANCSAFIIAANPHSQTLTHHENRVRHERLRTRLEREGLRFEEGAALDPERSWPTEPGFLVAGLDSIQARRFGLEFDQNAVVYAGPDAIPQLLLLR